MSDPRLPDSFFDAMYDGGTDPWGFEDRWYEERKRALTLAALPHRRYRTAFEPGCSLGILTAELAQRCDRLLATDVSDVALAAARERLADYSTVEFRRWALGDPWPAEHFDLVVISEVGYYLGAGLLRRVLDELPQRLNLDAAVLAVHWRHPVADYPLGGDDVHRALAGTPALRRTSSYVDDDVTIETFARADGDQGWVAAAEGLG